MIPLFGQLDLRDPECVIRTLEQGAQANLTSPIRRGTIEIVDLEPSDRLILTGDLHDHPVHMARVLTAAGFGEPEPRHIIRRVHVTLHELIHGDVLTNGMDFSYRVLTRVAALKAADPVHVHALLANHELSQVVGAGIVKDGVRVVDAFNEAVQFTFGELAPRVDAALRRFILSMPLAVRFRREGMPDVLCAHSLPAPELMDRFDPSILERPDGATTLSDDDLVPRRGSAHLMLWGRDHAPGQLDDLARRWNVGLFVLGHEKAESGWFPRPPCALILNSDHPRGVYLDAMADTPRTMEAFAATAVRLAST